MTHQDDLYARVTHRIIVHLKKVETIIRGKHTDGVRLLFNTAAPVQWKKLFKRVAQNATNTDAQTRT